MIKVTLHPEVKKFLKENATIVDTDGKRWYYLPYWITDDPEGISILALYDKLPDSLRNAITKLRGI